MKVPMTDRGSRADRRVLAFGAVLTAAAHVPVIPMHLREAPYMGALFVLLVVACLLIATAVTRTDNVWVPVAAAAVSGTAILGYAATRVMPFPLLATDVGDWLDPWGVVSVLSEAMVAFASLRLMTRHRESGHSPRLRAVLAAATLCAPLVGSVGTASAALGANLVTNPGLENQANGFPVCFKQAGYGTNTSTFSVVTGTAAHTGQAAERITQTNWVSGDHKVVELEDPTCGPHVVAGHQYQASVWYTSTTGSVALTVFKHTATGWSYYTDLKTLTASGTYTQAVALSPVIPAGVDQISFGISIYGNGVLTTDDYSLNDLAGSTSGGGGGSACTASADVCAHGRWDVQTYPNTVRSVHSVLLNTGKVLFIAGSGNDPMQFAAGTFKSTLWDPKTGQFVDVPTPTDLFCSGHVQLPNGNVLVLGGNLAYPAADGSHGYEGRLTSYIFNVSTQTYQQANNLNTGHWYPSATELGNGNVVALGGLNQTGQGTVETEEFSNATQQWMAHAAVPQTYNYWGLYPAMVLMQDGRLFYSGSHVFGNQGPAGSGADVYDVGAQKITDVAGLQNPQERDQSAAVLLPPAQAQKVMVMGGGNVNTNVDANRYTDLIDLTAPNPTYTPGPLLPQGKYELGNSANMSITDPGVTAEGGTLGKMYASTVLLPNRKVLETGGALHNRADPVFEASVYDPSSNAFTSVAPDPVERQYHSESFLIPDGRVVSVGSNPGNGSFDMRISIYSPPYMFATSRPGLTAVDSTQWAYGSAQRITADSPIVSAQLIKPAAVTHSSDPNQRLLDLPLSPNADGSYSLNVTSNPNLAPPGFYMLSVQRADGTPSASSWVHLG